MAKDWLGRDKPEDKPTDKTADQPQDATQQEEFLNKLRMSFEEVVKPIREKVESFDGRFQTLEESTRKPTPKVENAEISSVLDDEERAFAQRLGPVQGAVAQLNGRLVEDSVVNDITAQGWGELVPDLRKTLASIAAQYKVDQNYEVTVRKIAFGMIGERAVKKGLKADPTKQTYYFSEDAGGTGKTDNITRISDEDIRTMNKLGIPESKREEFMKQARPA